MYWDRRKERKKRKTLGLGGKQIDPDEMEELRSSFILGMEKEKYGERKVDVLRNPAKIIEKDRIVTLGTGRVAK